MENSSLRVSDFVRQAARIARLRDDYINLWWLEWELVDLMNKEQRNRILHEIMPHFTKEQYTYYNNKFVEEWNSERNIVPLRGDLSIGSETMTLAKGVGEIENDAEYFAQVAAESVSPQGLHPVDLYHVEKENDAVRTFTRTIATSYRAVLIRIRDRTLNYLSQTEKQLIFGQIHSDIFEENRLYVDRVLGELCPDVLAKFVAAHRRMKEDDPESWVQALTSCRRLLKSLADKLYPPTDTPVKGIDGKERKLTEEMYVARLWQYVYERASSSTSGALLQAQIQDYGNRVDRLYELSCKGVHGEISKFEANQCVIQTYIMAGDLLRLAENSSAMNQQGEDDSI